MSKISASIFSISGLALLNEVLAGETFPIAGGTYELSGSDAVTGVLAFIGLLIAFYSIFPAFLQTIGHWRERNEATLEADMSEVDFSGGNDASWLYGFPTLQFLFALSAFMLTTWTASIFGIFVAIIYRDMILSALAKVTS